MKSIQLITATVNQPSYWVLVFPAAILVIVLVGMVLNMKKKSQQSANYAQEHPEVARVYVKSNNLKMGGVVQESLFINSVDDNEPQRFTEGLTTGGFFVLPGEHVVTSTFRHTRPGVAHKSVTKTYGPNKQKITVEAGKSYRYEFDYANEKYSFTEMPPKEG